MVATFTAPFKYLSYANPPSLRSSGGIPNTGSTGSSSNTSLSTSGGSLSASSPSVMPPITLTGSLPASPSQPSLSPGYSSKTLPPSKSPTPNGRSQQSFHNPFNTFTHSGRSTTTSALAPSPPPSSPRISVSEEIYVTPMSPVSSTKSSSPAPQGFLEVGAPVTVWRRTGKTLKQKDEITVVLAKKKNGLAQASRSCSSSHQLWYFEVYIECSDKRGVASVGLAPDEYPLDKPVGKDATSYAYNSEEGKKWQGDLLQDYGPAYGGGDVVGCGFNSVTREIFFTKNGTYLGVAFWDVPQNTTFYPTVSLKGAIGMTIVATFQGPFKFDICDGLPAISPSVWSESLGPSYYEGGPPTRSRHSFTSWPANDVSIWLESIGYGRYNSSFCQNNISGRHLLLLTHALLKNELGIDSYGHRADILDRVKRMQALWRERGGDDEFPDDGGSTEYHHLRNLALERPASDIPTQSSPIRLNNTHILHNNNNNYNIGNHRENNFNLDVEQLHSDPEPPLHSSSTSKLATTAPAALSPLASSPPTHSSQAAPRVPSSPLLSTVSSSTALTNSQQESTNLPPLQEWEIDFDELEFGPVIGMLRNLLANRTLFLSLLALALTTIFI